MLDFLNYFFYFQAYAYKRKQNGLATIVYFGEGASSEGDTHTAMNFASVFDVPLIFFW
jgi:TPP-dependent pyruvate/acetoin dehydrogenase alpha subunit